MRPAFGRRSARRASGRERGVLIGAVVGAIAIALAGCGGKSLERPAESPAERAPGHDGDGGGGGGGGGKELTLPVKATALFEAGDLDRDGTDDLVFAAGRDHHLFTWTSRRSRVTRLTGADLRDSEVGSYPVGAGAGGVVLTGARLSWVAARRVWPASVDPVVLDANPYRPQGAAVDGNVLVVDALGRARIVRTGDASGRPIVQTTTLMVDGAVGADGKEFAFTRGRENWLRRASVPRRLAGSADKEFPQVIAPFGDRAVTLVRRVTGGRPGQQTTRQLVALLVGRRLTSDALALDGNTVDIASRSTRHGLAVVDRARLRVTVLDIREGRIRARVIPSAVGIADKDGGVAILRPNGEIDLSKLP